MKMSKKEQNKSEAKIGTTTLSFLISSLKYRDFISQGDFPEIVYFTGNQVKTLKIVNQVEYFKPTIFVDFEIENDMVSLIDPDGTVVKPSSNAGESTTTYTIPFVDFLKAVTAYNKNEDVVTSHIYATKDLRLNNIYWLWNSIVPNSTIIRAPKVKIYVNLEV